MIEHARARVVSEIRRSRRLDSCVLGCTGLQCSRNYLELSKSSLAHRSPIAAGTHGMNRWSIPDWLEREVTERDRCCVYCGVAFGSSPTGRKARVTWEHIVNDARIVTRENIARCCASCNASKGAKDLADWLTSTYRQGRGITSETVSEVVRRVFVSKDENLTKAHVRYLESRLLTEAAEVSRFTLEQNQAGGSRLPESDREDMEVFLARIRQLLPVLGSDILSPHRQKRLASPAWRRAVLPGQGRRGARPAHAERFYRVQRVNGRPGGTSICGELPVRHGPAPTAPR